MKISCPSCSAKYSIADEKVQNRLAKIRCRKCGTSIVIDGNVSPANVYAADGPGASSPEAAAPAPAAVAPAAAAASTGTVYSVDLGENDQRQMSVADIVAAYNEGTVTAETFVWTDGFADWTALAQVEDLVAALHAAAQVDSPTAPTDEISAASASTEPDENPWESSGRQAAPAAGGADLFGNVASAGSDVDHPAVSPPQASSSPFGGGEATGARNESSVLFSLSALTSGASQSRPSMPQQSSSSSANNDDSGLIDLKALTAAAEATAHAPAAAVPVQSPLVSPAPLGGSPLGGPSAYRGGGAISIPPQAAKGNNTGLIIGGFLFAAIVAVALIFQFGGEEEPEVQPPAPVTDTTPAPAAEPETAPVPTAKTEELPTAEAKPPSTGTEEEEGAPSKATTAPRPRPRPSSSPSPSSAPSPSPAPAPKPAANVGKCGCKKDDLMCLMNCAQ